MEDGVGIPTGERAEGLAEGTFPLRTLPAHPESAWFLARRFEEDGHSKPGH